MIFWRLLRWELRIVVWDWTKIVLTMKRRKSRKDLRFRRHDMPTNPHQEIYVIFNGIITWESLYLLPTLLRKFVYRSCRSSWDSSLHPLPVSKLFFFHLTNFFMLSLSKEKCVMYKTKHAWVNKAIHLVRMCWVWRRKKQWEKINFFYTSSYFKYSWRKINETRVMLDGFFINQFEQKGWKLQIASKPLKFSRSFHHSFLQKNIFFIIKLVRLKLFQFSNIEKPSTKLFKNT